MHMESFSRKRNEGQIKGTTVTREKKGKATKNWEGLDDVYTSRWVHDYESTKVS